MKMKRKLWMAVSHGVVLTGFSLLQGCATGNSPVCWLNWPYNTPSEAAFITPIEGDIMIVDDDMFLPPIGPVDMPPVMDPTTDSSDFSPARLESAMDDHVYSVKKGDTLSGIASMYGTTWKTLASYNNLSNPNKLFVNQEIRIPGTLSPASRVNRPSTPSSVAPITSGASRSGGDRSSGSPISQGSSYVIQPGDTLSKIASRAGLSVEEIKAANALNGTRIVAGKSLSIPRKGEVRVPATTARPSFTPAPVDAPAMAPQASIDTPSVEPPPAMADLDPVDSSSYASVYKNVVLYPGDTVEDLARRYKSSVEEILLLNGLSDASSVKSGTKLLIPVSE
jgi:LysM repeat protein